MTPLGQLFSQWFQLRSTTTTKNGYKTPLLRINGKAEKEGSDFSDSERSNVMPAFDIVKTKIRAL